MTFKAIVFDYGGVMTFGGAGEEIAERIAMSFDITVDLAIKAFRAFRDELITGAVSEEEFWMHIETYLQKKPSHSTQNVWNTWLDMRPKPEMLEFVAELKSKGYLVGLLSNVIPNTQKEIKNHGVYELFRPCLLSCETGFAKPNIHAYEQLVDVLKPILPNEIIFVDDSPRCLEPARAMGIHTILATGSSQIIANVHRLTRD